MTGSTHAAPVSPPRASAEVSYENLRHNYSVARAHGELMAVLKAGAYGHGLEAIACFLEQLPADQAPTFLGVASVIEARRLAKAGVSTRIYLLGPTCPFEREEIVYHRWTPSVSNLEEARDFDRLVQSHGGDPLPVHITVDTGMGRGGFLPEQLIEQISELDELPHLSIEGLGSHLPSADEDEDFTKAQFARYDALIEALGPDRFRYLHLSNSAGLLGYHSRYTNLYRPGLMCYGISPLPAHQSSLRPALTLKSRVSLVRSLPAGHGISYGRQTVLQKDTLVATVGIGYGDGYPRELSMTGASVLIRGKRCPLLGRVTMDQIMVDVSQIPDCTSGDEVELFGENILVSEIAQLAGGIPWSILTGITPRVTRVYL
ncbi:alanine racemase [Verrucomicrobiaceae bacterium R5-34]|uniref:Alanine racemase n=1 Tax=Oceaniferula flava TaxID=2800421 RepID=A0AAE2SE40_9BACT|nr:alanine racemase [Oceaniferula flavus]MBK1830550.1 alanine racemase [Verrucomicrobiaceae bacterium R5-34]MBK1854646.1 alanine racemase [Oceaniferula flavus]MBM1135952.1 alanine racemase [Oceaniferula flavus]